jgi:long-chain fatty acid transport protein
MMFRVNRLVAGLMLMGCAPFASAAGFALIEQNASGLGNAYAGQAAAATDASTIFFNPAGMTYLPDRQVVMAGHLIRPQAEFSGTSALTGNNGGDAGGLAFVPNAYFAFRLTPDVHLGVGMNAPFGLATKYDPTWKGRTQAIKSEVKTIVINPSIAWKASESLSLGAGLSLQYIEATLTNATGAAPGAPIGEVKGDDYGWGFNLGALWKLNDSTRIGITYRSEIDNTLEGTLKVNGATVVNPVFADVTLPDSASLSLFHKLDTRWELLADVTWTGWSDFDELRIVNTAGAPVVPVVTENWKDTYRYSVGVNYHYSNKLTLRGGVAFDQRAASDEFRTARIPDEDRTWLAFGAQYRLSERSRIDVGYAHLFVKDASLDEGAINLSGTYDASVDILSAQLTVNF